MFFLSSIYIYLTFSNVSKKRLLLESKVSSSSFVNLADGHGRTALHVALEAQNADISRLLIGVESLNVNLHDAFGTTPLHLAVRMLNEELCLLLVSRQADVNAMTVSGQTALHWLISEQNSGGSKNVIVDDIARVLLSSGAANVCLADKNDQTPLSMVKVASTRSLFEQHIKQQQQQQQQTIVDSSSTSTATSTAAVRIQAAPVKKAKKIIKIDLK